MHNRLAQSKLACNVALRSLCEGAALRNPQWYLMLIRLLMLMLDLHVLVFIALCFCVAGLLPRLAGTVQRGGGERSLLGCRLDHVPGFVCVTGSTFKDTLSYTLEISMFNIPVLPGKAASPSGVQPAFA